MPMTPPPREDIERACALLEAASEPISIRGAARQLGINPERLKAAVRRGDLRAQAGDPLYARLLAAVAGRRGTARDWKPCPSCGRISRGPASYVFRLPNGTEERREVRSAAEAFAVAEDLAGEHGGHVLVRRVGEPRHWEAGKTTCPAGHPYDEANTLHYRGKRYCRACRRAA